MAYRDESGRITIDEVAAENDIRNISASIESLREARASVYEIKCQTASFAGKTARSIQEASDQLLKKYDSLIAQLEETNKTIRTTVTRYQQIDAELKNTINGGN